MKWFKHETDSHMNLKLQSVIEKFGLNGYGYYWACVELVGKESENYRIKAEKDWKIYFKKFLNLEIDKQNTFLEFFADRELIDKKALNKGDLYIPKLEERCDEYTEKRRRISRQAPDNVGLEEKRREENTIEENTIDKITHGEFKKVKLTSEEHTKLIEKIGEKNTKMLITELDSYIKSLGKDKYKDHYATLLNWARRKYIEYSEKVEKRGKKII